MQGARYVVGPEGQALTVADLPVEAPIRWIARRKAELICAVYGGLITLDDALSRYNISFDEYMSWARLYKSHGLHGMRVTRLQEYRG